MKVSYTHITNHQSSREGARIHGAVLHTTEGSDNPSGHQDLITLGQIFDGEEASAHLGVNVDGVFGRYVADSQKAWAVCNYNAMTISLEQIGFAATPKEEWFRHRHAQLHGAAEFLTYCHVHYGIPLKPGKVSNGAILEAGVLQHSDLGIVGSGHVDCGPGYPQGYVTLMAQYFIAHRLHPKAPHTKRLWNEITKLRKQHGVKVKAEESSELAWANAQETDESMLHFGGTHSALEH